MKIAITIAGKDLSEETIKKACEAYGISFEKKHIFEAGDLAINGNKDFRLICKKDDYISDCISFDTKTGIFCGLGQGYFESFGYKYIGKIQEVIEAGVAQNGLRNGCCHTVRNN